MSRWWVNGMIFERAAEELDLLLGRVATDEEVENYILSSEERAYSNREALLKDN